MQTITNGAEASALAERLNGNERTKPTVVVTTPAGQADPWIDVREIEKQVGELADVVLMPTGGFTWEFSNRMPPLTQVYGGAGRVYPVGHEWTSSPRESPLRFCYRPGEGERATKLLIDDAMAMAAAAGLLSVPARTRRKHVEGVVEGILADRALIRLRDGLLGSTSPALAHPGLPVERVLSPGMRVSGWYDDVTHWFDVREMVQPPAVALSPYAVGDVVLALVGEVLEASAELFLLPAVSVRVPREAVTSNELDDLRSLLTRGEVVIAHVTSTGPDWRLRLLDVDDEEEPVPAASLVAGGPSWLELPPHEPPTFEAPALATVALDFAPLDPPAPQAETPLVAEPAAADPAPVETAPPLPVVPSPRMLDPNRPRPTSPRPAPATPTAAAPAAPAAAPSATVRSMSLRIAELEAQAKRVPDLEATVNGLNHELQLLRHERHSLEAQVTHQEKLLQDMRTRLRKTRKPAADEESVDFADAEVGFRFHVLEAWARRTPVGEQAARPLGDFAIGPEFLTSVARLEGIGLQKIADVVFEVVTDRAKDIPARELHALRESEGGGSPQVRRPHDGALAWRANLQTKTASARRLHYWQLPGGGVELWHVGLHDEVPSV